jgi:antitoxin Phd
MTWKLAEAKNRLTEVVNLALSEGPQTITRRGDTVLLVSAADYAALTGPKMGFKCSVENLLAARDVVYV